MTDKFDVRRHALSLANVTEAPGSFEFRRDGRAFVFPYLERVAPKKARVPRYDRFVLRVATEDDKDALLAGEPSVFFTTDHYNGWAMVIVRLTEIDDHRLGELIHDAWEAAPTSSKFKRPV